METCVTIYYGMTNKIYLLHNIFNNKFNLTITQIYNQIKTLIKVEFEHLKNYIFIFTDEKTIINSLIFIVFLNSL